MANIKSAKKRILVNRTKAERNKAIKSSVKTAIKKVNAAVVAKDKEAAAAALLNATSVIDKATKKGVYQHFCEKSFPPGKSCKQHRVVHTQKINKDIGFRQPDVFVYFSCFLSSL